MREETEAAAQETVCDWLDLHGILYCHVPNGGKRSKREAARFRRQGVKPGVPDVLIFDPPPTRPGVVGAALELKVGRNKTTNAQDRWLVYLAKRGWAAGVCYGANEAIDWLESLGYGHGGR